MIIISSSLLIVVNHSRGIDYLALIFTFALCVIQCLPFAHSYFELYKKSTRVQGNQLNWQEGSFSSPILAGLFYPFPFRYGNQYMGTHINKEYTEHEVYAYFGIVVILLGAVGFLVQNRKGSFFYYTALIFIFIVLALNKQYFIFNNLDPPFISLFRYWGRSIILFIFTLCIYAGYGTEYLVENHNVRPLITKDKALLIILLISLAFSGVFHEDTVKTLKVVTRDDYRLDHFFVWLTILITSSSIMILINFTKSNKTKQVLGILLILLVFIDLAFFGNAVLKDRFLPINKLYKDFSELVDSPRNARIIIDDEGFRGNQVLYYGYWSPFGYSQSIDAEYDGFLKNFGISSSRKLENGESFINAITRTQARERLNASGIQRVYAGSGALVWEAENDLLFYTNNSSDTAKIREITKDEQKHAIVTTFDVSKKVYSYVRYDQGWKVKINDTPIKVTKEGLFLSFEVPEGKQVITLEYIPHRFYISLLVSALGLLLSISIYIFRRKLSNKLWIILILMLFLIPRATMLGRDILNSDGARWHRRSEAFLDAIKRANWADTYQHYQPGVTLMWINATTKQIIWKIQDAFVLPRWSLENSGDFPKIHGVSKATLVAALSVLFLIQLVLISKISSVKESALYGFFLATEPYIIGLDRWFHLTSLESYFGFTAFLLYLYGLRIRRYIYFTVTGILLALAVLSKLTAIVILPLVLFCELSWGYYSKNVKKALLNIVLILTLFFVTILALFPAFWANTGEVIGKLITAIDSAVRHDTRGVYFAPPLSHLYYLFILSIKMSPITLALSLLSIIIFLHKLLRKKAAPGRLVLAYFLNLFLALTLSDKKIDRYSLILFHPLILVATLYLAECKKRTLYLVCGAQMCVFAYALYANFPVMSGYYNPIFSGQSLAQKLGVYENSGEYFAQVALDLNSQPWGVACVPDNIEPFKYFFKGISTAECSDGQDYYVTSLDFDRQTPKQITNCPYLVKSFGPKLSTPVVFLYACKDDD